jgi:hypothetical protein
MRTYRFSWKKKPWYKRLFAKEKYEWNVDVESPANTADIPDNIIIGSMSIEGAEMSYNVNVYEDGTSVIYQNDRRNS